MGYYKLNQNQNEEEVNLFVDNFPCLLKLPNDQEVIYSCRNILYILSIEKFKNLLKNGV